MHYNSILVVVNQYCKQKSKENIAWNNMQLLYNIYTKIMPAGTESEI
jgi:hypothetical protein